MARKHAAAAGAKRSPEGDTDKPGAEGTGRSIWKGLINFGLVNIPVSLQRAARDHSPRFRLLHRTDLSPITMARVCQTDGKPVAWNDLVKGYEIEPGRFVTVTEDDFKTVALERSRSLDIIAFVPAAEIETRFWDTPYLAVPARGAEHSYALLAEALAKSGRIGIAKYVMRERQHLAGLLTIDGQLVVSTMRFPEDLVALPASSRAPKLAARELALAAQLIDGMAEPWQPAHYSDDYVPALMKVIRAKAKGAPVRRSAARPAPATPVDDLISRLRASLAAASGTPARAVSKRAQAKRYTAPTNKASARRRRVA